MSACSSPPSHSIPVPNPDICLDPSPSRCPGCKSQRPGYNENSRNLVVCIDGTCNEFGEENTNVVKLFAQINLQSQDPEQLAYYSSGIGTDPNSRGFVKILDTAIGWNIGQIIKDVYRWLAEKYREGDQIYLFGFSRGAYQVRVLAGMIHEVGLIRTPTEKQIRAAYDYFESIRSGKPKTRQLAREFKNTFSWKDLRVHFVGVWDTVSSVGLMRGDLFLSTSSSAAHACHFRHALALDERRVKFMPEYFRELNSQTNSRKSKCIVSSDMKDTASPLDPVQVNSDDDQIDSSFGKNRTVDMKEVWFAGCHSDVGGKQKAGRSHVSGNVSLLWMRQEATKSGLKLQPTDLVWVPADLDSGISDSMNKMWSVFEYLPFKYQVSFSGLGEDGQNLHLFRPRRVIPGQKIHASILYANQYIPQATLGKGFDIPIIQAEDTVLNDEIWETGLFDETAAQELVGRLSSKEGVPSTYLDRLLFMLRSKEGKSCVRNIPNWQGKFTKLIRDHECKPLVKLVAILTYFEASCDPEPPNRPAPTHNEFLQDILDHAKASLVCVIQSAQKRRDGPRIVSLLRLLAKHQVLRERILTSEVLEKFIPVLDAIVGQRGGSLGQAMDSLICLLQCEETQEIIVQKLGGDRLSRILETNNPRLLVAALRMVLTLARIPDQEASEARDACFAVRSRLEQLAMTDKSLIGLLAVEILLALHDPKQELYVLNKTFQANLWRALVHLQPDPRNSDDGSGNSAVIGLQTLRQHFGLDAQNLNDQHEKLIRELKKAIQKGSARERTVSMMTLLKLCESATIRKYFGEVHLLDVFIDQLRRRDRALVAAYALSACLRHDDMRESALSNEKLPKHIVRMLRLDYFDDAMGTVEGFQIFGDLMSHDGLREMIREDVVTDVLNMKLGKGKVKEVRTSLICLDIFRSFDKEGRLTHNLVTKGLEHLQDTDWEEQKAGVTILSALARTNHGVAAIDPRMVDIVMMLLPKGSSTSPIRSVSSMMGPACALRILAQNPKLRHSVHITLEYNSLKYLYLSGTLLVGNPDTSVWKVKTPDRSDVVDMLDNVIKAIDGELLEQDLIPIDGDVLPHIQHLDRCFRMIGNGAMVAMVALPFLLYMSILWVLSLAGVAASVAFDRMYDLLMDPKRRDVVSDKSPPESSEWLGGESEGARSEDEGEDASCSESESENSGRNDDNMNVTYNE